jgi:hypothetical protein
MHILFKIVIIMKDFHYLPLLFVHVKNYFPTCLLEYYNFKYSSRGKESYVSSRVSTL